MAKKSSASNKSNERTRLNPITGNRETIAGTKAGKKRMREAWGSPLRTHDLPGARRAEDV